MYLGLEFASCEAGGVASNCVAVGRLVDEGVVDRVYVRPAAGDTGQCLGAAYAAAHKIGYTRQDMPKFGPFLGREYGRELIQAEVSRFQGLGSALGTVEGPSAASMAATMISKGRLLGLFSGRSEFGPRALGARSIVADPRNSDVRLALSLLKGRESFLPFAPAVLTEYSSRYFKGHGSDTMTVAVKSRAIARSEIPGRVHADGTSRVQNVGSGPSALRNLISEFFDLTGVPVLTNTSFNLAGQPIVESPADALDVLVHSRLDGVLFDDLLVIRDA